MFTLSLTIIATILCRLCRSLVCTITQYGQGLFTVCCTCIFMSLICWILPSCYIYLCFSFVFLINVPLCNQIGCSCVRVRCSSANFDQTQLMISRMLWARKRTSASMQRNRWIATRNRCSWSFHLISPNTQCVLHRSNQIWTKAQRDTSIAVYL